MCPSMDMPCLDGGESSWALARLSVWPSGRDLGSESDLYFVKFLKIYDSTADYL